MKTFFRYYLPVLFWLVLIFVIPTITRAGNINRIPYHLDKVVHFLEFGILGVLLARAFYLGVLKGELKRALLLSLGIAIFIAGADEFYQIYVPGRIASFYDFVADVIGITSSQILFRYYLITKR